MPFKTTLRITVIALLLSCLAGTGRAATAAPLAHGDLVRVVQSSQRRVTGAFAGADSTRLWVRQSDGAPATGIPLDDITRIERREGTHRNWVAGLAIGAGAGALLGAAAGALFDDTGEDGAVGSAALVVGTWGAAAGLVIGGLVKSDTWENVPLSGLAIGAAPGGGVSLAWRVRI